jgi:hypothetical protein
MRRDHQPGWNVPRGKLMARLLHYTRGIGAGVVHEHILDSIKPGDRVTILVPAGIGRKGQEWKQATGRAVMRSAHGGWVLNMGGPHGTPGIADEENTVRVKRAK